MKKTLYGILLCSLIVTFLVSALPASVSAQVPISIYVDDNFTDNPVNHKWNTIQEGINDARDNVGDTVYVYAGTYNENVVVNKAKLTIWGQSSSLVTVNGGNAGYTIDITASTATIRQLKITGGNPAGVYWRNASFGTLEKCDITGNQVGVLLQSLVNQTVQCNNIHTNTGDGIKVNNSSLKDLIRNNVYGNGNDGISLINSTTIVVARNKSYNNTRYGIYVDSTSTINDIYLNDFYGNGVLNGSSTGSGNNWQTGHTPYYGNYWGDYTGSDGNGDGIGDTPYNLGTEQDLYPLMVAHANYTTSPPYNVNPLDEVTFCTPEQAPPAPPGGGGIFGGGCFIATASYGPDDGNVETLRNFRDGYMATSSAGSTLISAYYRISPPIARFIDNHPALKPVVRTALLPAVGISTLAVNTTLAEKSVIAGFIIAISAFAVFCLRKRNSSGKDLAVT